MNAPSNATELLEVLAKSNLIAPSYLHKLRSQVPPSGSPGSEAKEFAIALVQAGVLTRFHTARLLAGRSNCFYVGKYRLLDLLGEGGMGKVYLAEQTTMKRAIALKLIPLRVSSDDSTLARFSREARAVAKLRHPNVTQAYDFDQSEGHQFIAMEYVEGLSLQDLVHTQGPLPYPQAVDYVCQAALGLEHAHGAGLVHRDIKPGNLMVDRTGTLKILDLGLVIFHKEKDFSLTLAGGQPAILGTADYVSPEQALSSHQVDIRSDIYSLGCVLYFLLAGRPPFEGKTAAQKLMAHQTKHPRPIQERVPDLPDRIASVLKKMIAKEPDRRYATPVDVQKALARFAEPVDPPFEPRLIRYKSATIDKLLRYGGSAPASATRLTVPGQGFSSSTEPHPGPKSTHPAGQHPEAIVPKPSPQVIGCSNPKHPPEAKGPDTLSRQLHGLKKAPNLRLWLLVGGGCFLFTLVSLGLAVHWTTTDVEANPSIHQRPNKGRIHWVRASQTSRAIARACTRVKQGGTVGIHNKGGGWRVNRLLISGDQLPNKGQFTIRGKRRHVMLAKSKDTPLLRIVNAPGFVLEDLILDGSGRKGPVVEIEGQADGVTIQNVTFRNFRGDAIRFIGAQGTTNKRIRLVNVQFRKGRLNKAAVPIAFRSRNLQDRSSHIEIAHCDLAHNGTESVLVGQPVENVRIRNTLMTGGAIGIRFASTPLVGDLQPGKPVRNWKISRWWPRGKVPAFTPTPATTRKKAFRWKDIKTPSGIVALTNILGHQNQVTTLGHATFRAAKAGPRRLFVGADDEIVIWVNGTKVFEHHGHQGHTPREFTALAHFRQGVNHLWVQVTNGLSASAFSIHVADYAVPLTQPSWSGVEITRCTIENTSRAVLFTDPPAKGSRIQIRENVFRKVKHHPVLIRKTGASVGLVLGSGNRDIAPPADRVLLDDARSFVLVPLK